jgi:hypothetical protein
MARSGLDEHPNLPARVVDLQSTHVRKDHGEAPNVGVWDVTHLGALGIVWEIFQQAQSGGGSLALPVVHDKVLLRVQLQRPRQTVQDNPPDIPEGFIGSLYQLTPLLEHHWTVDGPLTGSVLQSMLEYLQRQF